MMNNKRISLLIIFVISYSPIFCQTKIPKGNKNEVLNCGIEVQGYPAGIIPGLTADFILKNKLAINTRLGVNLIDRHDWAVNENEYGFGYGGTVGLRYYQRPFSRGFLGGVRLDFWREKIYWKNSAFNPIKGESKTLVLQPTLEIGYFWRNINRSPFGFGITTAMGFEINFITKGKPVGQGLINLVGVLITYNPLKIGKTIGTPSF